MFRTKLAEAPKESLNAFQWHTVKRGETLLSISRKLKVRQADLAEANSLSLRARVQPGQQLIIPRAPTTLLAARTEVGEPDAVIADTKPVRSKVVETAADDRLEPQRIIHRVKRGETLSSIARHYNTTIASLKAWNSRIIRGSQIKIGDRLTVFAERAAN
jgi:LysM repeat protein